MQRMGSSAVEHFIFTNGAKAEKRVNNILLSIHSPRVQDQFGLYNRGGNGGISNRWSYPLQHNSDGEVSETPPYGNGGDGGYNEEPTNKAKYRRMLGRSMVN